MAQKSSEFAENVLKLSTGSAVALGLGILVAPIVARLFTPYAFGIAALFSSITVIVGTVACLRYELCIMIAKTDEESANLFGVSLIFVVITSILSSLVVFFADDAIARLFNSPELKKYIWLIPIAIFFNGAFLILNYWNSRTKHFKHLSIARIISSMITQLTKLVAGFAGFISGGVLISATILGRIVSIFFLGGQIWRDNHRLFQQSIRWKKMIAGLKRYKEWPIFSTPSSLLNVASQQLPIWILAFFFSPKIVGFLVLSRLVLGVPIDLIGKAIAQVFFQKATEAHNHTNELPKLVEGVFKRLISLSIIPALLLTIIGKEAFIIIFGAGWAEAGVYVQILASIMFFQLIFSSISCLFSVLEKQRFIFIFNCILFFTRAIALIIGGMTGDIIITLLLLSSTSIAWYVFVCFFILSNARLSLNRVSSHIVKYILYCLPSLGLTVLVKWGLKLASFEILLTGFISSISYYIIIFKQDEALQRPIKILFQKLNLAR